MDKLTAMTTFVTVADLGSFSRAAELLSIPNARVSQRVSDLERYLGVKLINRTTRSLKLTHEGQAYLSKCRYLLEEIELTENDLKSDIYKNSGIVRVDALTSVARWIIAPRLHEFHAMYPDITIRLSGSDYFKNILEESIDCTIRSGEMESSSLIARHLGGARLGLYTSPLYINQVGELHHPSELEKCYLISWFSNPKKPFIWQLHKHNEVFTVNKTPSLEFDDPDTSIVACLSGLGISPAADFAVAEYVKNKQLVALLPEWSFGIRQLYLVYNQNKYRSHRIRIFIDWLMSILDEVLSH